MKREEEIKVLLQRVEKILDRINAIPNQDKLHSFKSDSVHYQSLITQKYFYEWVLDYPGFDVDEAYTHLEELLDELSSEK